MSDEVRQFDELGPVDYLVMEFPRFRMTGEGLAELVALVDRGIIRVLDLVFLRKDDDGKVSLLTVADLDGDGKLDLSLFEGVSSGLLGDDDLSEAAKALEPGSAGGILVYENLWAAPLATTLRHNGAQVVAGGRIPVQDLLGVLDATEPAITNQRG